MDGSAYLCAALAYLLSRRLLNAQVRYISLFSDYFALCLLLGLAVTGILMRYFSGTDERRTAEFLQMLRNPEVRAIFCARGGYGSGRIIPYLEPELLRANPKIVKQIIEGVQVSK